MIRRTKDYILENKMINNHSTVLVALSGGADSVCLLLVLNEIKRQCADELDFSLEAVGLRQISAKGLTYRVMCIPWMYRNMQKVMDSGWRRLPGYCAMKRLKRKSPLPMQQTKSRVTAGR